MVVGTQPVLAQIPTQAPTVLPATVPVVQSAGQTVTAQTVTVGVQGGKLYTSTVYIMFSKVCIILFRFIIQVSIL